MARGETQERSEFSPTETEWDFDGRAGILKGGGPRGTHLFLWLRVVSFARNHGRCSFANLTVGSHLTKQSELFSEQSNGRFA